MRVADLDLRAEGNTDRATLLARRVERHACDQPGGLCHPEDRHQSDPELPGKILFQFVGQRLRDRADEAEFFNLLHVGRGGLVGQDVAQDGRNSLEPGWFESFQRAEECRSRDVGGKGDRAAGIERREQEIGDCADVEHRHHVQADVGRRKS